MPARKDVSARSWALTLEHSDLIERISEQSDEVTKGDLIAYLLPRMALQRHVTEEWIRVTLAEIAPPQGTKGEGQGDTPSREDWRFIERHMRLIEAISRTYGDQIRIEPEEFKAELMIYVVKRVDRFDESKYGGDLGSDGAEKNWIRWQARAVRKLLKSRKIAREKRFKAAEDLGVEIDQFGYDPTEIEASAEVAMIRRNLRNDREREAIDALAEGLEGREMKAAGLRPAYVRKVRRRIREKGSTPRRTLRW